LVFFFTHQRKVIDRRGAEQSELHLRADRLNCAEQRERLRQHGNAATVSGNDIIVPLTNVANAQRLTISLFGVTEGSNSGSVGVPFAGLLGDTTNNATASDVGQTKSQSGAPVDGNNFRTDVTPNGAITSSDLGTVKAQAGTSIP
jgi:hypothetical protein